MIMNIKKNRIYIKIMGALMLLLVLIYIFSLNETNHSNGTVHTVVLTDKGYEPAELYIKQGDTVVFSSTRNFPYWPASDKHPSHSIYPEFDPKKPIASIDTWEFQFQNIGTWMYHDHLNSSIRGTIHVSSK